MTDQSEVLAHLLGDPGTAPQGRGRVEGGDEHRTQPPLMGPTTKTRDPGLGAEQELGGEVPQGHDDPGVDHPDLLPQVALAGVDLLGTAVPIAGRRTLEDMGDVDLLAGHADLAEELAEEAPSSPRLTS